MRKGKKEAFQKFILLMRYFIKTYCIHSYHMKSCISTKIAINSCKFVLTIPIAPALIVFMEKLEQQANLLFSKN